ncbi:cobalamin biosynthesis protein CobD/CbiB [Rheinheimera baltica]|uniref:cobalamin biosynthesis protein CobD/CbiB n=1 Tax=Rheinheimera baltica TaxID=67576 RepID=UPI0004123401|nr:cobalamin biosynthesis protein [Rheinheimera baltica]
MFYNLSWPEGLSAYPALVVLVVVVARLLPMPPQYHPLTLFRLLAQQLGKKVNPDPSRSRQQLMISGALAILVIWLPIMALLYSLYWFSELPLVLDALLLYCSLDWHTQQQQALVIQRQLQACQLTLAREQAKQLLCRRTASLSEMGLSKALIESLTLRSARQLIAVCCWFLIGGGLAAIGYRLLIEMHQQWNIKRSAHRYFGVTIALLANLTSFIPKLISVSLLAFQHGILQCYRQCRQPKMNLSSGSYWLLCCASVAVQRNIGGPVFYNEHKLQRSKMLQGTDPKPTDIARIIKRLHFVHLYLYVLIMTTSLLQLVWLQTN